MCHFKKYFKYICGLNITLLFGLVYAYIAVIVFNSMFTLLMA